MEFRLVAPAPVRKTRADFALPHNRHQIPGRKPRYLLSRCSTALFDCLGHYTNGAGGWTSNPAFFPRIFAHISTPDTKVARLQGVRPYLRTVDMIVSFGCISSVKFTERPELQVNFRRRSGLNQADGVLRRSSELSGPVFAYSIRHAIFLS